MEKILKQFLIDDIIYNVLFDYLLPTEQYDDVINEINDIGVDDTGYYLYVLDFIRYQCEMNKR